VGVPRSDRFSPASQRRFLEPRAFGPC
jgi:hypothetical protein